MADVDRELYQITRKYRASHEYGAGSNPASPFFDMETRKPGFRNLPRPAQGLFDSAPFHFQCEQRWKRTTHQPMVVTATFEGKAANPRA